MKVKRKKRAVKAKNTDVELKNKIFDLFKDVRDGFYIEAGAYDGKFQSNTYRLEKELGWKGVRKRFEKDIELFEYSF